MIFEIKHVKMHHETPPHLIGIICKLSSYANDIIEAGTASKINTFELCNTRIAMIYDVLDAYYITFSIKDTLSPCWITGQLIHSIN